MPENPSYEELRRRVEEMEETLHRKEMDIAPRKPGELFEKLFKSQSDAIFILDAEIPPKIIDCNPAAEIVFGYSRHEMLKRSVELLHINQETLNEFQERLYPNVTQHGLFHLSDFMMKRKDGKRENPDRSLCDLEFYAT